MRKGSVLSAFFGVMRRDALSLWRRRADALNPIWFAAIVVTLFPLALGPEAAKLARITAPTLVLHGAEDPLVPLAGGQDTARRIPGARLEVIPDMAHDLAPAPHPEIVRRVLAVQLPFLQSVDAAQP